MDIHAEQEEEKFPRAILHVDGDSFFVSCELARRPDLWGKPAVTGAERGIATSMNPAAKKLGVIRGMRVKDIRRLYPSVVILSSDYVMYSQYARRMYSIVRKHAGVVEEYSIDECFADLTGLARARSMTYEEIARGIQEELHRCLGITFSLGVGVNKVTAKAASKWRKPAGLTVMSRGEIDKFLGELAIGKVWGIGSATTMKLRKLGVTTALDLKQKSRAWVAEHADRPLAEIYEEFQGNFVKELVEERGDPSSVQRTRTFHPPTRDRGFLWSQLSYHAEDACGRLRAQGLVAGRVGFFLKTQDFSYVRGEVMLVEPSAAPEEVLRAVEPAFERVWKGSSRGALFRACGISLGGLQAPDGTSMTLFGEPAKSRGSRIIHAAIDRLARKFGKHSVFLGSSLRALKGDGELDEPTGSSRPLDLIYLGEVN